MEELSRHYISQIETQTKGKYRITVAEIKPSLIFKSTVTKLQIYEKDGEKDNLIVNLPEVKVGVSYLPLIAGNIKASFIALSGKGKIDGDLSLSDSEQKIDVTLKDFNLENLPYLALMAKVPLKGIISGTIDVDYNDAEVSKSNGVIDLKLSQFVIPQSHLTPMSGIDLDLPETILSDAAGGKIKIKMKSGKIDVQDFSLPGPDIVLALKGNVAVNKKINFSKLNITGTFNISDKIKEALPFVIIIDNQKNEQGTYPISIAGRLTKPQIQIGTFDLTALTGGLPAAGSEQ
ncbi:MAG: hypothetical protein ACD_73C00747G0003 [uncultured bacterium]|nr:MAG: hypothetical protein ACD_73C00747G0003 [uncultured bacterium]